MIEVDLKQLTFEDIKEQEVKDATTGVYDIWEASIIAAAIRAQRYREYDAK